ncbi:MAG: ribosome maturation factor RimM [bacterium]|nr:ribosome maturation factor RimM [bacterium]
MQSERITIGKIIKPHGIHGECVVFSLSDIGKHWVRGKVFFISWDDQNVHQTVPKVTIETVRYSNQKLLIKFAEINQRSEIERLVGSYLEIETRTPIKQKWIFYIDDLLDCQVYTETLDYIGVVVEVLELPANHCIEVRNELGDTAIIPFLKKFVKKVDIENKKIIVKPIEGLIDWLE